MHHYKQFVGSVAVLTSLLLAPLSAQAQLGGLLRDLKNAVQKERQNKSEAKEQEGTTPGNPAAQPPGGERGKLLAGYCERISNSRVANKLGELVKSSQEQGEGRYPGFAAHLNNPELANWVTDRFAKELNINIGTAYRPPTHVSVVYDTINNCLQANTDKAFYYSALEWNIGKGTDAVFTGGQAKDIIRFPINRRELFLMAYLFNGADEKIEATYPQLVSNFENEVNAALAQKKEHAKQRQAQMERDEANAKADKEWKEQSERKRATESAFLASPDGQLVFAYQRYQVISVCHDMRKELAVQFVSYNEMADFKTKMRSIENTLKPQLKEKNTDKLWSMAEGRNRKWDLTAGFGGDNAPTVDLIEHIRTNNKSNWTAAREDCNVMAQQFRTTANELLGKESIKKNF